MIQYSFFMVRVVVLEGLDGVGKETHINLLRKKFKLKLFKYPTKKARKIKKYLQKKIELTNEELFNLFLEDILDEQNKIKKALKSNKLIILDRYLFSTIAYTALPYPKSKTLVKKSNPIKPDLVILLDIPPKESYKRKKKQKIPDRHESDVKYLVKVRKRFLKLYKEKFFCKKWKKIDGKKSIGEIHKNILSTLNLI